MAKLYILQDHTDKINNILEPKGHKKGLYLGSQLAAQDQVLLKSLNITSVLTVASQLPNKYSNYFSHMKIDIDDQPLAYLYQYFEPSYQYLRKQLQKGNVLVHCKMGISRSASIVIAYIMRKYNCSYQRALEKVKTKRNKINPNEGFKLQLKQYEKKILERQKETVKK